MLKTKHKNILVHVIHHPVENNRVSVIEVPFRRQSISQLKNQFTRGQDVFASLDKRQVDFKQWPNTHVKPGSKVVFLPAVADPGTASFLMFEGWAAIGAYIAASAAISYGLAYLGGKLFGSDIHQPDTRGKDKGQSYSWEPHTTKQAGIPYPYCWGTNKHYGNIVAQWTDVDGNDDEILYMIIDYGSGPVQGLGSNTVYFNGQPSTNYPDVTIQERLGTFNQTCMTGFEKNKLEYRPKAFDITYTDGPEIWTTPNNFFDDLEYTIAFPRGIYRYRSNGDYDSWTVEIKVEISIHDADSWTTLLDTGVQDKQMQPLYKAYTVSSQGYNCVRGNFYDLRFSKTQADRKLGKVGDSVSVRAVREVVNVAFRRPGKALLGITALATNRLSGHIDVNWVADGKLVQVYNGSAWVIEFSRNRAWVALAEATQPVISGDGVGIPFAIERYDGLDPGRIDLAFWYEWAQWCDDQVTDGNGGTEARMPCDHICDYQTDVWSLLHEISNIGRMRPYWRGNVLTGWVDKAVTDTAFDLVTFDNMMVKSWKSSWAGGGEMAGGADIYFQNAQHDYERDVYPANDESAGRYTRRVSVEGTGVKGMALAARVGNHLVQRNKLIKNINSCQMFKDALRYRLGQVVRLQSTVPNWGASYRVVSSPTNNTVVLDRACTASTGDIVYVRSFDESAQEISIDSYTIESVDGTTATIVETWNVTPIKGNIFAVGAAGKIKKRRLITMRHASDNYFYVEFETYDTALFDSDSIDPNIDNPDYIAPEPSAAITKPLSAWEVQEMIFLMLPGVANTDNPWLSNCTWTGSGGDTVTWSKTDSDDDIELLYKGVTYAITPNSTTDEWVMCRNKNGVAYPATPMALAHAGILQAGTITAALGQIAALTVGTAEIIDLNVTTLKVANNAITSQVVSNTAGGKTIYRDSYTINGIAIETPALSSTGNPTVVTVTGMVNTTPLGSNQKMETTIYRREDTAGLAITGITLSGTDPVEVTFESAHGLSSSDIIMFSEGVGGTVKLSGSVWPITVVDADTVTLDWSDSSDFSAWTSGGDAYVDGVDVHLIFTNRKTFQGEYTPWSMTVTDNTTQDGVDYIYSGCIRQQGAGQDVLTSRTTIVAVEYKK
jgi:hypothetical protein